MRPVIATLACTPCGALPPRHRGVSEGNNLSALLRLLGADEDATEQTDAQPVALRQVRASAVLFHEGGPAESLGFIRAGAFKLFKTAEDGYQHVIGFAERGEVLGHDALWTGHHPAAAQALEDAWIYSVRVVDLFNWCHDVPAFDRALHLATSRQLARRTELADVMAAVAAEVRLARFLVQMAGRMQSLGRSPRRFVLRMTRRDLASLFGVAHETVSRAFTALAHCGCVRVAIREVEILDVDRLRAFSRGAHALDAEPAAALRSPPRSSLPHAHWPQAPHA